MLPMSFLRAPKRYLQSMDKERVQLLMWILLLVNALEGTLFKEPCRNRLDDRQCLQMKKVKKCTQRRNVMKALCNKACGFCSLCQDNLVKWKCDQLKKMQACHRDHQRMKLFCPETCGFCPLNCRDKYEDCAEMKSKGYCKTSRRTVQDFCAETCGFCGPRTPCDKHKCPLNHKCIIGGNFKPLCICQSHCSKTEKTGPLCTVDGNNFANLCLLKKEECKLSNKIKVRYYGKCANIYHCRDSSREAKHCPHWQKLGACHAYSKLMQLYCPKTCGLCRQPAPATACLNSAYGCCWDSDIPATGKNGGGCKECKDSKFCLYFAAFCGSPVNVKVMKENCPLICGYCDPREQGKSRHVKDGRTLESAVVGGNNG